MGNNKYGNIEESELQKQLDKETDEGKQKQQIQEKNLKFILRILIVIIQLIKMET